MLKLLKIPELRLTAASDLLTVRVSDCVALEEQLATRELATLAKNLRTA